MSVGTGSCSALHKYRLLREHILLGRTFGHPSFSPVPYPPTTQKGSDKSCNEKPCWAKHGSLFCTVDLLPPGCLWRTCLQEMGDQAVPGIAS